MKEMELLGTRVVRGPDWKWENQDGGEGSVGTVVQIGQEKKSPVTAQIVWSSGMLAIKQTTGPGLMVNMIYECLIAQMEVHPL